MGESLDAIVIGAGIAGLTAALQLHEAGRGVLLLEAADRIGGRVHGLHDDRGAVLADLGPSWVWPRWQPVVQAWIDRLGLTPLAQFEAGDAVLDGWGPGPIRQLLPGQDGIARIRGGPSAIVQALAARLPAGTVRTGAAVAGIAPEGEALRITLADGATLTAPQVVLAAPLRVIAERIAVEGLAPGARAAMEATPTWMAPQAKAVAVFERPFWRGAGLSGRVASRLGPLVEMHDLTPYDERCGVIFGFVGVPPEGREPGPLEAAIRAQLLRCFGPEATPERIVVQDWARDPLICAARDLRGPQAHPETGPEILRAGHLGGRLWLAVSEVSELSPGLIEGALAAGSAAAERAMAAS
ncbi:NAD(P)-binding protein [Halovulum dunhuangense]|uniref:NAD(P)-binding protein n=1 Tax=Halovulum dunhuangense TaxID=1505036 RepID=A0A849L2D9_9RHOB|nr:FAD-dependent oxidoreductase [Halovulum dunhuangense]NNU80387.1 NAD(P)-binding protein [Halovulum dunhuangense]